jgi:hypothetical protein
MQSKQNPKKSSFSANLQSSDVMLFPRDISYDYAGDKKSFMDLKSQRPIVSLSRKR